MRLLVVWLILLSSAQVSAQEAASSRAAPDWTRELAQIDSELALEVTVAGLHRRGICLVKLDRLSEALVAFRRALRRSPYEAVIAENLQLVERRLGIVEPIEES